MDKRMDQGALIRRYALSPGGLVVASALLLSGCSHAVQLPSSGQSSFSVVPAPPDRQPATPVKIEPLVLGETRKRFIEADPVGDLPPPKCPREALAGNAGWVMVGVRIFIDSFGRVSKVEPGTASPSSPTELMPWFMAAIKAATAQWRFEPGMIETDEVKQAPDGHRYWAEIDMRPTVSFTDLAFNFSEFGGVTIK